jgi:eukaryotic-like serine/threonine-protein kinase
MRRPAPRARFRVPILALVAAGSMMWPAATATAAESDWPMAGHDPAHSGTVDGPAPPYEVSWSQEVGERGPITGAAVTERAVVLLTRESVVALDPATGEVLWEEGRTPGPAGVPAIAGNLVLFASSDGALGQIVARDVRDGALEWQTVLGSAAPAGPTVTGDTVVVGTLEGEVVALDLKSGLVRWRFETAGALSGAPAVDGELASAASYRSSTGKATFYGIDLGTGEVDPSGWQFSPVEVVGQPSAVASEDGVVYVGTTDQNIRALREGVEIWTSRSRDLFGARQIPAAGEALIIADRSHMYRLDLETGEEAWTYQLADLSPTSTGGFNTLLASAPAISGTAAIIGSGDGTLSAIDIDSGLRVWHSDLGDGAVGAVAATGDRVYAVTLGEDGSVVALEHDPDGTLLREVSPTVLFLGRALLNFATAAVALGALLLLVFRFALRPRGAAAA